MGSILGVPQKLFDLAWINPRHYWLVGSGKLELQKPAETKTKYLECSGRIHHRSLLGWFLSRWSRTRTISASPGRKTRTAPLRMSGSSLSSASILCSRAQHSRIWNGGREWCQACLGKDQFLMGLQNLVGGSTCPVYSVLRFVWQEKRKVAKMTHLSSGISVAI